MTSRCDVPDNDDFYKSPDREPGESYHDHAHRDIGRAMVTIEKFFRPSEYANKGHFALGWLYNRANSFCDASERFEQGLQSIIRNYSKTVPIETLQELLNEGTWPNE